MLVGTTGVDVGGAVVVGVTGVDVLVGVDTRGVEVGDGVQIMHGVDVGDGVQMSHGVDVGVGV